MNLPVPVTTVDHHEQLRRLVEAFLKTQESDHTRTAYRGDLKKWINWCAGHNLHPLDERIRSGHVQLWLGELRDRDDESDATRARRVSAVSSWYGWLIEQGTVESNPAALPTKKRPKVDKRRSNSLALSADQSDALLAAADADSPRTAALVATLIMTGARVGELLAANVEDLTYQKGRPVLPVTGKGRRKRFLVLPPEAHDRITRYMESRTDAQSERLPALEAGARPVRPLFATARGVRMERTQVRRDLKRLARQAGGDLVKVVDRLSPHVTRHSYATDLLSSGAPLRDVQYAMGHASPDTTERYDHGELDVDNHPNDWRAKLLRERRLP